MSKDYITVSAHKRAFPKRKFADGGVSGDQPSQIMNRSANEVEQTDAESRQIAMQNALTKSRMADGGAYRTPEQIHEDRIKEYGFDPVSNYMGSTDFAQSAAPTPITNPRGSANRTIQADVASGSPVDSAPVPASTSTLGPPNVTPPVNKQANSPAAPKPLTWQDVAKGALSGQQNTLQSPIGQLANIAGRALGTYIKGKAAQNKTNQTASTNTSANAPGRNTTSDAGPYPKPVGSGAPSSSGGRGTEGSTSNGGTPNWNAPEGGVDNGGDGGGGYSETDPGGSALPTEGQEGDWAGEYTGSFPESEMRGLAEGGKVSPQQGTMQRRARPTRPGAPTSTMGPLSPASAGGGAPAAGAAPVGGPGYAGALARSGMSPGNFQDWINQQGGTQIPGGPPPTPGGPQWGGGPPPGSGMTPQQQAQQQMLAPGGMFGGAAPGAGGPPPGGPPPAGPSPGGMNPQLQAALAQRAQMGGMGGPPPGGPPPGGPGPQFGAMGGPPPGAGGPPPGAGGPPPGAGGPPPGGAPQSSWTPDQLQPVGNPNSPWAAARFPGNPNNPPGMGSPPPSGPPPGGPPGPPPQSTMGPLQGPPPGGPPPGQMNPQMQAQMAALQQRLGQQGQLPAMAKGGAVIEDGDEGFSPRAKGKRERQWGDVGKPAEDLPPEVEKKAKGGVIHKRPAGTKKAKKKAPMLPVPMVTDEDMDQPPAPPLAAAGPAGPPPGPPGPPPAAPPPAGPPPGMKEGGECKGMAAGGVAKVRHGFPNVNKKPKKMAKGGSVRGCGVASRGKKFSGIY